MRLVYAGTPEFARVALERLHAAGFEIPLVLTQPDRPAGRGMKLQASPVKQFALAHGMAVAQPHGLRLEGKYPEEAAAARAAIEAARADVMVVAAYGLILPQWLLDAFPHGCLNIHASLLPRWRGAAPIHRAIEAGDSETGVTIMQMDAGLDTGDMLLVESLPITANDTTASLHDKLAVLGGRLIVETLEQAACGGLHPVPQPAEGVTYAHKIEKQEAAVDWRLPATVIERRIRAFNPFPGAATLWHGEPIKLWQGHVEEDRSSDQTPGSVLAAGPDGITVLCGQGVLRLTELQRAGGKRLPAADFLRGFDVPVGAALGT
ncbi:methionyl-tRNA formyltransferase [Curvibacter sp. PAE-UM]|uniref:methionyl-tRNA formyltransferase n=1 Tax=Curvibacter sp. PAE-UM TaxID=1714344 RepID=UPI00070E6FBD|nr:methionyl-tRNA formyltransferase [Curvibacter sp. PAE-UM]KRH99306.1 methionyl-tRNA formyltransferase [Curvibacter sp. PAE-UM]